MAAKQGSVLFVCLGNICRSPIAEAVFVQTLEKKGLKDKWTADSAALGDWHVGNTPDRRARNCMKKNGVPMDHKARQVDREDFFKFDWIFGMDEENIQALNRISPKGHKAKIELLGKYDPEKELIIRDPYYDRGDEGFEKCYQQCLRCVEAFLDQESPK